MNNYEYIIASLPSVADGSKIDADNLLAWIKGQCSSKDNALIDQLVEGFSADRLDREFYTKAFACRNAFIREYFRFDLAVRNTKVRFLNKALGRMEDEDIFMEEDYDSGTMAEIAQAFSGTDLLERERDIDDLYRRHIESLTIFNYFDINVILAFIAKLHIIDRWLKLDEETGRKMFRELVNGVRSTFKGVEYNEQ